MKAAFDVGGTGSGQSRYQNRGAVEQTLRIDVRLLRRRGALKPPHTAVGCLSWSRDVRSDASISFRVDWKTVGEGTLLLQFTVNGELREQSIVIESDTCRYGGRRHYFRCPRTWRRCEVLCCVGGYFASRQAHRLNYASQSLDRLQRLHRANRKIEARFDGKGMTGPPRGRRRELLIGRWERLNKEINELADERLLIAAWRLGLLRDVS